MTLSTVIVLLIMTRRGGWPPDGVNLIMRLGPLAVLARGFAVVTRNDDGSVVSRVAQASDEMKVRVSDGEFEVKHSR